MNGIIATDHRLARQHAWLLLCVLLGMLLAQGVHAASHDDVADAESCVECLLATQQQVPSDFAVTPPSSVPVLFYSAPRYDSHAASPVCVPRLRGPPAVSVV